MEFFPAWWFFLLPVALGLLAVTMNQEKQIKLSKVEQNRRRLEEKTYDEEHTRCPKCAEDVKLEAVVCRHCGTDVSGSNLAEKQRRNLEFTQWAETQYARARRIRKSGNYTAIFSGIIVAAISVTMFVMGSWDVFTLGMVISLTMVIPIFLWGSAVAHARSIEAKVRAVDLWPV